MSEDFRQRVREWLEAHAPRRAANGEAPKPLFDTNVDVETARTWQRSLAEAGFTGLLWPVEHGGAGLGPAEALIFADETAAFDIPRELFYVGVDMIGPTLIAHGTPDQHERYLNRILRGDDIWCQLWSEPDAGSDLSALTSRADPVGDGWVVSGRKVWTSGAQFADLGLGIFRSDFDAPKRAGITCLVIPMDADGVEVRPLRQMTGDAHFNEVVLDGVEVPAENVVGEVGGGWTVARTTMTFERLAVGSVMPPMDFYDAVVRLLAQGDPTAVRDARVRRDMAALYERARKLELTIGRVREAIARGQAPGSEVSAIKLAMAALVTAQSEIATSLVGRDALDRNHPWVATFLTAPSIHIGGGTDEIQKTTIGERVLGLPGEPGPPSETPFRDLPRN